MNVATQRQQRQLAQARRAALGEHERAMLSQIIASRFLRSSAFFSANSIGCYLSIGDEVDTHRIFGSAWSAGKNIFAPVVGDRGEMRFVEVARNSELKKSAYGLWEPVSGKEILATHIDVVVTPVLAFDSLRNRIGIGGGYYDRAFSSVQRQRLWRHPKLVGIAFECQRVEKIRPNRWDIPLYRVLTESS